MDMLKMKGVVPPMLTPFDREGQLDIEGLKTLTGFLRERVHGLFICGSYGSGALMSLQERKQVTETVMETVNGRIPVVVMVGTTNNAHSAELAAHAQSAGADAVAAVGPYYYTHQSDSIRSFYGAIMEAADLPVYVYNNPKFQGYEMSLDLMRQLKEDGVHGIKDATFDILTHAHYHRLLKDESFDIVLGTEAMWLPARSLGCEAFIPGLASAFPEICVQMYEEGMRDDFAACRKTQFAVNHIREIMYLARSTQLAVYAMLEVRGVLTAYPRAPFIPATEKEKASIRAELEKMDMLG
jgi:dihydrodipicolinate synthase/N-acetylneuraminate lyase